MFKNSKEKQEAIKALTDLQSHPGWKFIERALDDDIEQLEKQLRTKRTFETPQEIYAIQDLIEATEGFKNLPEKIIAAAKDEIPEPEEEDIY